MKRKDFICFLMAAVLSLGAILCAGLYYAAPIPEANEAISPEPLAAAVRVNLNRDDAAALLTLPGMNKARVQALLRYRREHGRFLQLSDLLAVDGIDESMLEKWRSIVTLN